MSRPRIALATLSALAALVLLACCIKPDVTPGQDGAQYLAAMRQFERFGLQGQYRLEPLYPLFLAMLHASGLAVERFAPLIQNILFVSALYLFLRSLQGRLLSPLRTLQLALAITALPTFFILMNGALYTESLAATLILLLLSSFVGVIRHTSIQHPESRVQNPNSKSQNPKSRFQIPKSKIENLESKILLLLLAGFGASFALGLLRGACIFIHYLFGLLGIAWLLFSYWRGREIFDFGFSISDCKYRHAASANLKSKIENRKLRLAACLWFVLVAAGSKAGSALWLLCQQGSGPEAGTLYERAGTILYGRTEYAKRFNFRTQSVPYLLNALSESACRRAYGEDAAQYTFMAENEIGYQKRLSEGVPDAELLRAGLKNLFMQPLRQSFFACFELSRFILHHGTAGFAVLDLKLDFGFWSLDVGWLVHSWPVLAALKFLNLALLAALPCYAFGYWKRNSPLRRAWKELPAETRAGTACYMLYVLAYLAVYGYGTTVVRMAYPIAPFLIILDWQLRRQSLNSSFAKSARLSLPS